MTLIPYPYQSDIIARTRAALKAADSALIVLPTGGGKTVTVATMLKRSAERGLRSVFAVHRNELLEQSVETLRLVGLDPGIIAAGYGERPGQLVQVASIQSLARSKRLFKTPAPSLFVADEAQHFPGTQWAKVLSFWSTSKLVGLTATPERLDGRGLGEWFGSMVEGPDVGWLIGNGYLSPYRAFAPSKPQTAELPLSAGDYARAPTEAMMNKPSVTGNAVATYIKHVMGKKAIVFAVGIAHSQEVAAAFRAAGIEAAHLDGETPRDERRRIVGAFRAGTVRVLCNVDLFGEGFDVPDAEVGMFLRPTMSTGLWRQQVGRVLRYRPGKTAWLFDHGGNFEKHGLPDDPVTWSLEGRPGRSRKDVEKTLAVRTCPACYAVSPAARKTCEQCGTAFPLTPREIKILEGELAEIDRLRARTQRKIEQRGATTLDALTALGKQRGYKNPKYWAMKQMELREMKRRKG